MSCGSILWDSAFSSVKWGYCGASRWLVKIGGRGCTVERASVEAATGPCLSPHGSPNFQSAPGPQWTVGPALLSVFLRFRKDSLWQVTPGYVPLGAY